MARSVGTCGFLFKGPGTVPRGRTARWRRHQWSLPCSRQRPGTGSADSRSWRVWRPSHCRASCPQRHSHRHPSAPSPSDRTTPTRCRRRPSQAMVDYCAAQTGTTVTVNTIEHGKFQDNLTSYLQGTPDDIFTWFAGYRMRFFADQGLLTAIDDVWAEDRQQLLRRVQGGLDRQRRQAVLRPVVQLPVGRHLPQERLRREGLHRPQDARRVHRPRRRR